MEFLIFWNILFPFFIFVAVPRPILCSCWGFSPTILILITRILIPHLTSSPRPQNFSSLGKRMIISQSKSCGGDQNKFFTSGNARTIGWIKSIFLFFPFIILLFYFIPKHLPNIKHHLSVPFYLHTCYNRISLSFLPFCKLKVWPIHRLFKHSKCKQADISHMKEADKFLSGLILVSDSFLKFSMNF